MGRILDHEVRPIDRQQWISLSKRGQTLNATPFQDIRRSGQKFALKYYQEFDPLHVSVPTMINHCERLTNLSLAVAPTNAYNERNNNNNENNQDAQFSGKMIYFLCSFRFYCVLFWYVSFDYIGLKMIRNTRSICKVSRQYVFFHEFENPNVLKMIWYIQSICKPFHQYVFFHEVLNLIIVKMILSIQDS